MQKSYTWLIARLQEPSSWMGICGFVTALGVYMSPEMKDQIVMFGVAVGSFLAFVLKEKGPR